MDLFEKANRAFGSWYEGLFGGSEDVRPKDILRLILAAMEDNRKEGFDNRTYVPNQYILEIAVHDDEEKEYLLAFLDRAELEEAIRRYCKQNNYHIRGALEFTVTESEDDKAVARRDKVRVRCRYNTKIALAPPSPHAAVGFDATSAQRDDDRTMPRIQAPGGDEEAGTMPSIASAVLIVNAPNRPTFRYIIHQKSLTIGRSQKSGNDLTIETDTQLSRQHARIELNREGQFTLYDLKTTNGTKVNGGQVDHYKLMNGDEIRLGLTRIIFEQEGESLLAVPDSPDKETRNPVAGVYGGAVANALSETSGPIPSPPFRALLSRAARLIWIENGADKDDFLLATENYIGRGVTNDIVLPDRSVATRHAHIQFQDEVYLIESLKNENSTTTLNGIALLPGHPSVLKQGDRILVGQIALRFEAPN